MGSVENHGDTEDTEKVMIPRNVQEFHLRSPKRG